MTSITKTEETRYDTYTGQLDDLIAAGLVRRDQLPQPGKRSISWRHGVHQPRRCKQDEHYLRVVVRDDGRASVQIGISDEVAAPRLVTARIARQKAEAEREAWWAEKENARRRQEQAKQEAQKQHERAEKAKCAERNLPSTLHMASELDFRIHLAKRFRNNIELDAELCTEATTWHGYRLADEAREAILIAADALVDAMMQSEVVFDAALHEQIIADYRAQIRAADPKFDRQFNALSKSNPSILAGEQA